MLLGRPAAVAFAAAVLSLPVTPAAAQDALREAMQGRAQSPSARKPHYPPVGRYVAAQGDAFVFDRSNGVPLLKFEHDDEVFALKPSPGPRGDVIYRNDVGEPVLRATRLGGLTLFTSDRPTGTPAAFATTTSQLKPRALSPGALLQRLAQASARASRAARKLIPFEAPQVTPDSAPVFADAAAVTADAMISAATTPQGRDRLSRLRRVRFTAGRTTLAAVSSDTLEIIIAPAQGLAGRPSSKRTTQAILEGR